MMSQLEEITQELGSGIRLMRLESPIYIDSRAVFVADVRQRKKGVISGEFGIGYRERREIKPSKKEEEIHHIMNSLMFMGFKACSISPSKFDTPLDTDTLNRLLKADVIFTLPEYVGKVAERYSEGNIALFVDGTKPEYKQFPQAIIASLPFSLSERARNKFERKYKKENAIQKLAGPVFDSISYQTLFGEIQKKEEESSKRRRFYSEEDEKVTLVEHAFSGYLGEASVRKLEQILRAPLTDTALINERLDIIGHFADCGEEYSRQLSEDIEAVGQLFEGMKKLQQALSIMFQTTRGDLGGDLSRMYKNQGLGHDLPCKLDTSEPVIQYIKQEYYSIFMQELAVLTSKRYSNVCNVSIPDLPSIEMKRIRLGLNRLFDPENPRGIPALFEKLNYIKEKEPENAEEVLEAINGKDPISQHTLVHPFISDACVWLAMTAGLGAYFKSMGWVRPEILPKEDGRITIEDGWNPFLEKHEKVPNSTYLSKDQNIELVEGANQAGKSIYALQVPVIVAFAQAGLYVPAKSAKISPQERIYVRLKRTGSIIDNQSAFRHEVDDTNDFLRQTSGRESHSLICLDEWFTSTRPDNGEALLYGLVERELAPRGYKAVVTSHMPGLIEIATASPNIRLSYFPCDITTSGVEYPYKKIENPTENQFDYGVRIAEHIGLPKHIIDAAMSRLKSKK